MDGSTVVAEAVDFRFRFQRKQQDREGPSTLSASGKGKQRRNSDRKIRSKVEK